MTDGVVESLALEPQLDHQSLIIFRRHVPRDGGNEPFDERHSVRQRQLVDAVHEIAQHRMVELISFSARRHALMLPSALTRSQTTPAPSGPFCRLILRRAFPRERIMRR